MYKIIITTILISFGFSFAAIAQVSQDGSRKEILKDLKTEVKKDVLMLISKNKDNSQVRSFESKSPNLVIISDSEAKVYLDGQWYLARMTESELSDGGDLDNMELFDVAGNSVATRTNVTAFDSVILAMTGGDQHLQTKILP